MPRHSLSPLGALSQRPAAVSGAPTTPLAGYNTWFKADALGLTNGATVTQLTDQSGNSNHATSGSTNNGTFATGAVNSLPAVVFNGTSTYYVIFNPVTVGTLFVVCNHADSGSTFTTYERVLDGEDTAGWSLFGVSSANYYNPNAASGFPRNFDTTKFWINGTLNTIATPFSTYRLISAVLSPTNPTTTTIGVGNLGFGGSSFHHGDIAEYLFYPTALSDPNRILVESYLRGKYGL